MLLVSSALAADLLLTGATVWTAGEPAALADIWVHDAVIQQVGAPGSLRPPDGVTTIDLAGTTVIPGLIDAHVHLSMDPGAAWRPNDTLDHPELAAASLMAQHLRGLVAAGVTTVLDPAILPTEVARVRDQLAWVPGPRFLHLGPPFSPKGGYVAAVIEGFPSVSTPAEVRSQLDSVQALGASGVKVTVEDGMFRPIWPLHSTEILTVIRDGAAERQLPIYAHAMSPDEQRLAIETLGARVLVHPLDRPDAEAITRARTAGVYQITTLSPAMALQRAWPRQLPADERADLADPWYTLLVPELERNTATDPAVNRAFRRALMDTILPRAPLLGLVARSGAPGRQLRRHYRTQEAAIRALRDAGVPLVMGSDSGNWPIIPSLFHGTSSVEEVERLVRAGLTPTEALTAATRTAGEMLEMPIGQIRAGYAADLLVVEGNPLSDPAALRRLRYVVADGEARSPRDWMSR